MKSITQMSRLTRRHFLRTFSGVIATASLARAGRAAVRNRELTIKSIVMQEAKGRRLSPVAPNAYAAYRGYEAVEPVARIQTAQGLEGICHFPWDMKPEALQKLIGLDPFKLFRFGEKDRIVGPAERYATLLTDLRGCDIALVDLIGKALKRPAAALLGAPVREAVLAYDGSVYMEDLLKPEEQKGLVFIKGAMPANPVDLVVQKSLWVVNERAEGFKALKIKIGRAKWMPSFEEALARDIEVTNAIRAAVGPGIRLMVDGNRGYTNHPKETFDYAQAVAPSNVYFMEEMFPETELADMQMLKKRLRASGNPVKLAAGESHIGGVAKEVYTQRFEAMNVNEPLIDIEQADMSGSGFLFIRSKAAAQAKLGMTFAPHNFGSKLGFYAQVHLGTVTPNWDISEVDDSEYPAFVAEGVTIKGGYGRLTGAPGLGVSLREEYLDQPKWKI